MADLKPRQYKRVGRIAENNPERAVRVANRMEKRATREDRGKAIVKSTRTGGSILGADGAIRGLTIEASRKNITTRRPDTPLAASPEARFSSQLEAERNRRNAEVKKKQLETQAKESRDSFLKNKK